MPRAAHSTSVAALAGAWISIPHVTERLWLCHSVALEIGAAVAIGATAPAISMDVASAEKRDFIICNRPLWID